MGMLSPHGKTQGSASVPTLLAIPDRMGRFLVLRGHLVDVVLGIVCIVVPSLVQMRYTSTPSTEFLGLLVAPEMAKVPAAVPAGWPQTAYRVWVFGWIAAAWVLFWSAATKPFERVLLERWTAGLLAFLPLLVPFAVMIFVWPAGHVRSIVMAGYLWMLSPVVIGYLVCPRGCSRRG